MRRNHTGHRVGEDHHRAKLSDEKVRELRRQYEEATPRAGKGGGGGYGSLAREHGLSWSTVRDIVTYRTRASA